MATKVTIALEDDLEGGPADETVRFAVGGAQYEIDLNKKNARAFRKQLAPSSSIPASVMEQYDAAARGPDTSSSRATGAAQEVPGLTAAGIRLVSLITNTHGFAE